jgi:hypothetical protein
VKENESTTPPWRVVGTRFKKGDGCITSFYTVYLC